MNTHTWSRPRYLVPLIILLALVILRLCLPTLVKRYVNNTLSKIPGYTGRVGNIDIALWRGAYGIDDLRLLKTNGDAPVPFFSAKNINLSIQWKELFHGALVGRIRLTEPSLNFVGGTDESQKQTEIDASWQDRVQELFPLDINRFQIINGEVHFHNFQAKPPINIHLDQINLLAENLSNSRERYDKLLASIEATARPMNHGSVSLKTRLNPFADQPTFDLTAEIENVEVTAFHDFVVHYGKVKPLDGTISIYSEAVAEKGGFRGYVKPILKDLKVEDLEKKNMSVLEKVQSWATEFLTKILKNRKQNTVATKVEFSGTFEDPKTGIFSAIRYVLRNAFIKALEPQIENSLNLNEANPRR